MSEAKKHDADRPRLDLIPFEALEDIARVLEFGAKKYGEHNWASGMDWHRLHRATLSHVGKWSNGEDMDQESGLNHLAHAACSILFLLSYSKTGAGRDDRRKLKKETKL